MARCSWRIGTRILDSITYCHMSTSTKNKQLTLKTISPNLLQAHYEIRGRLPLRAEELSAILHSPNASSLPFQHITLCNLGNPQQLGQPPITFYKQVLSALELLDLYKKRPGVEEKDIREIENKLRALYPDEVIKRAKELSEQIGYVGAYTPTKGIPAIRQSIARFIQSRDGTPDVRVDPEHVFLTNGASEGIHRILQLIVGGQHGRIGVLAPIPLYPLYSATVTLLGAEIVPYYLDEDRNWTLTKDELRRAISGARGDGIQVKAMVMINPGNPTGNVFDRRSLEMILETCSSEGIVLLADEVYQENIYADKPFLSARRIAIESDVQIELFSFHSTSKGLLGECGRRGGYFQCHGIDANVMQQILKLSSMSLSSNIIGQVMLGLLVEGPAQDTESYDRLIKEKRDIHESLKRRGRMLYEAFTSLEGVTCNPAEGALYLFPRLRFPRRFIEECGEMDEHPEDIYCLRLLESTGICLVPGWGFGQKEGTYHLRSTILPPESEMQDFTRKVSKFHAEFMSCYK